MLYKFRIALPVKILGVCLLFGGSATAQTILRIFPKGDKPNGLVFFGLTLLALFLVLIVHELGHLLAGIVQGFRFELFIVGLLGIKREGNSVKLFLNKNLGYMGGIAATVPTDPHPSNRRKFAMVIASGPIASIVFSLVAFILFLNLTSGTARGFWFVAAMASIGIFLATTLPKKSGVFFTDRARFQRLMSKGKVAEIEEALLTIIAINVKDSSYANIPLEKARLLQSDTDDIMKFLGYYYEFRYFKDNAMLREAEETKTNLYSLKNNIPPHLWTALKIDAVAIP